MSANQTQAMHEPIQPIKAYLLFFKGILNFLRVNIVNLLFVLLVVGLGKGKRH